MDKNELNRKISTAKNIKHLTVQEGYFEQERDKDPYFGRGIWFTFLDGDEIIGDDFPKDWEHDLNAAIELWQDIPFEYTPRLVRMVAPKDGKLDAVYKAHIMENELHIQYEVMNHNPARAICEVWLLWKSDTEHAPSA